MTPTDLMRFVRRWGWLVLLLALVGGIAGYVQTRNPPYVSSLRATILIPGDTEIPGSSERPELMVLDDAPALVGSTAFAERVHAALSPDDQARLPVDAVKGALAGSRYSRVLTITATRADAGEAAAIAGAAASVLPQAVNDFLIPNGGAAATVRVIDPPSSATRDGQGRLLRVGAQFGAAALFGVVLAVVLDGTLGARRDVAAQRSQEPASSDAR